MTFQTQNLTGFQIGFDINFRIRRKETVKLGKVIQKNVQRQYLIRLWEKVVYGA